MAPTTPEAQPGTSTAGVSPPASPVTATDDRAGGAGAHVQEQQKRQEADPEDLPAAAQGRAQKALQAVKERPKNSTDPDADEDHKGFGATDIPGQGTLSDPEAEDIVGGDTGAVDMGQAKASWLTKLLALMWPYITAGAEKMVWEMLPPMLEQNKPTWMTDLSLKKFDLGDVPPTFEDIKAFPGTDPGAEDLFLEFDFEWRGQQDIQLTLNPAPAFLQSIPLVKQIVDYTMTWSVGLEQLSMKGRLRTSMIPMLFEMPIVGAIQVAFVDPPKVDFKLTMPAGKTDSGMLRYMEGFIDAFISDNVLSNYLLPDHYFQPLTDTAQDILTPEGVMEVRLLEAQNIPKMDWFGKGEPFVKMWLRPRARRESPVKQGSNVTWTQEEGSFAMPVHTRVHQVMTTALLDSDIKGSDEIGRGHYNLGQLTPGKTEDVWIDIGVPSKQGQKENNTSTLRDKITGTLVGASGSHPKDVESTRVHVQLTFHNLSAASVKAINQVETDGGKPTPELIQDYDVRRLVEKHDLMEEMFARKDGGNRGASGGAAAQSSDTKK